MKKIITLNEMAMPLKDAKNKAEAIGKVLADHLAYIFILGKDFEAYNHWVKEAANFCAQIDSIVVKGNKRLDKDFFIDAFFYHLDTDNDAQIEATSVWAKHGIGTLPSLLELNLTREDFRKFKTFRNECAEELAELFSSKESHSKEFFQQYINKKMR